MRILVTGGAGYIGTRLVKVLNEMPEVEEISVYDNLSRKNYSLFTQAYPFPEKMRFINGDILDSRKLQKSCEGKDTVIHAAAKVSTPFASEDPHQFEQMNHWGTAELCYAAEAAKVQRLIYLSSTAVYGFGDEPFSAGSEPRPGNYYGISKLKGEKQVERLNDKMEVLILRCSNVYGYSPAMRLDAVINKMAFEANYYNRITLEGNGRQQRAFIPIDLLYRHLLLSLQTYDPGTYNLVDKNLSVLDIAYTLKELFPQLEFLYTSQHMEDKSLMVQPDERLASYDMPRKSLPEELSELTANFSFHPFEMVAQGEAPGDKRG